MDIKVYGAIHAQTGDGIVARAAQLYDAEQQQFQSEINRALMSAISGIKQFDYVVVQSLPTASEDTMYKIYLVPAAEAKTSNVKDEYITIHIGSSYQWEKIGSTDIDLSAYSTTAEMNAAINLAISSALSNYMTRQQITTELSHKQDTIEDLSDIRSGASAGSTAYQKPKGGIPSTDMSQEVQTSLEKANTALQEHQSLDAYAKNDGYYETMGVGTADNLTGQTERSDDAMYRKTGGSEEVASGTATISNIKGNTVAWNQLVDTDTTEVTPVNNRKICTVIDGVKSIITSDGSAIAVSGGTDMVFDLTLIYGEGNEPTTPEQFEADYFKWFGKPLTYEEYDAGSLRSVQLDSLKTTGFNQWDGVVESGYWDVQNGQPVTSYKWRRSKNAIKCFPNTRYYFKDSNKAGSFGAMLFYDAQGNYLNYVVGIRNKTFVTPQQAYYIKWYADTRFDITTVCINISDTSRNGEYEPYEEHSVSLPVTTITGKLNGEGESVVVFPDGLKKSGSVYDEIYVENGVTKAIKRVGSVDMGTLSWSYSSTNEVFTVVLSGAKPSGTATGLGGCCTKYPVTNKTRSEMPDKSIIVGNNYNSGSTATLVVKDSAYSDKDTFKTAMDGVILYYELATPQEYILDDFQLPIRIQADALGTEEQTTPSGVASAPATIGIKYAIDAVGFILNAPKGYISEASMDNFLSRLGSVMGGTWSKTWNAESEQYDFSFTQSVQSTTNEGE